MPYHASSHWNGQNINFREWDVLFCLRIHSAFVQQTQVKVVKWFSADAVYGDIATNVFMFLVVLLIGNAVVKLRMSYAVALINYCDLRRHDGEWWRCTCGLYICAQFTTIKIYVSHRHFAHFFWGRSPVQIKIPISLQPTENLSSSSCNFKMHLQMKRHWCIQNVSMDFIVRKTIIQRLWRQLFVDFALTIYRILFHFDTVLAFMVSFLSV